MKTLEYWIEDDLYALLDSQLSMCLLIQLKAPLFYQLRDQLESPLSDLCTQLSERIYDKDMK
jgi:hypothetical protein